MASSLQNKLYLCSFSRKNTTITYFVGKKRTSKFQAFSNMVANTKPSRSSLRSNQCFHFRIVGFPFLIMKFPYFCHNFLAHILQHVIIAPPQIVAELSELRAVTPLHYLKLERSEKLLFLQQIVFAIKSKCEIQNLKNSLRHALP
jgi:hypothetical protein